MSNKEEGVKIPFNDEGEKFIPSALKWLYEMEALNSSALLNNLYANIYASSRHVKDVELLIDRNNKKMLIYMKFSWKAKLFLGVKKRTATLVLDNLQELLPSFEFRITEKRELFDLALENAKKVALGGRDEESDESPDSGTDDDSNGNDDGSSSEEQSSELQEASDILSDQEEQTKSEE